MPRACLECKMSLICATADVAQPLVCPGCQTEWFVVRPVEGKSYATNFVAVPDGCPKGPKSKACPACQKIHNAGIQTNFDEAAKDKTAKKRREKLKKELLDYMDVVKNRLEADNRYGIHPKDLPEWDLKEATCQKDDK